MKKDITIVAEPRSERGKNEARRLRVTGKIPAVVYGAGRDAAAVSVDPREINQILYSKTGHNTIFTVDVPGGENTPAMIVDWQHDPVKETLLHVDLARIELDKKLNVKVPVRTVGEPVGVKVQGGLLEVVHREVELECLPNAIPEVIEIDVKDLSIGDTLRASDLPLGEGLELQGKKSMVICHVVALRTSDEETEETEEEEEAAAPEPEAES